MEPQHIKQVITQSQILPPRTLQEIILTLEHIHLTEEEVLEAIIWRKQKKEREIEEQNVRDFENHNRSLLTRSRFTYEQTKSLLLYRRSQIFSDFKVDENNQAVYDALLYYFSEDKTFTAIAETIGTPKPSLDKGILLMGSYGVGKTLLMKLFCKNQRQVFYLRNAKKIADDYQLNGQDALLEYIEKPKNAINDAAVFYQPYSGLCIDDIGTEDIKQNYGNKKSVVGDIIEMRYSKENTGIFLHATTNLSLEEIKKYYGERVLSRCYEIFNFIVLKGTDRRR